MTTPNGVVAAHAQAARGDAMEATDGWIRRLATLDRDACERLAREYHGPVFGFLRGLTGDSDLAEDLAQQTAVCVWTALKTCRARDRRALSAWVYRIALNVFRQHRRRPEPPTARLDEAVPATDDPAAEALRHDAAARVRHAVAALPEPERVALTLRAFAGMTHTEVARVTGEPVGTVKWRVARAYEMLRLPLRSLVDEDDACPAGCGEEVAR
jgi:RNA polymerase sigma-70 factor (ECF subfamily)